MTSKGRFTPDNNIMAELKQVFKDPSEHCARLIELCPSKGGSDVVDIDMKLNCGILWTPSLSTLFYSINVTY